MESLGIDTKLMLAQLLNFLLFFFIFKKFVAKPFAEFLKIEEQKEKEKERILADLKRKEAEMLARENKLKQKIKEERDKILREAKQEAQDIKKELINQAQQEAREIVTKGRRQIEEEERQLVKQMRQKTADLSISLVNKALSQFLSEEMRKSVTDIILKNFSKG